MGMLPKKEHFMMLEKVAAIFHPLTYKAEIYSLTLIPWT